MFRSHLSLLGTYLKTTPTVWAQTVEYLGSGGLSL